MVVDDFVVEVAVLHSVCHRLGAFIIRLFILIFMNRFYDSLGQWQGAQAASRLQLVGLLMVDGVCVFRLLRYGWHRSGQGMESNKWVLRYRAVDGRWEGDACDCRRRMLPVRDTDRNLNLLWLFVRLGLSVGDDALDGNARRRVLRVDIQLADRL